MGEVVSVSARKGHGVGKTPLPAIELVAGQGVLGDAHCGEKVKHRSRARYNPGLPNLRQVHLIHAEILVELASKGFEVSPGQLGENIATRGIDLLGLSTGSRLIFPSGATVELTGLRNPCVQLDRFMPGLMAALIDRAPDGGLIRKAGVMAIVVAAGSIAQGDAILCQMAENGAPLRPV